MKRAPPVPGTSTVLITAFEPFGRRSSNRSQLVLEHLARAAASPKGIREGVKVVTRTLPVSFGRLDRALQRALSCRPDVMIMLGESAQAEQLRLERVATNRITASIADNDGAQPLDEAILPDGPAAYFATVRPKPALAAVRRSGAPAALSTHAGGFACNAAYYLALHRLHRLGDGIPPVVFVHIPVKGRALALRDATKGVLALLRHLVDEAAPKARRAGKGATAASLRAGR